MIPTSMSELSVRNYEQYGIEFRELMNVGVLYQDNTIPSLVRMSSLDLGIWKYVMTPEFPI